MGSMYLSRSLLRKLQGKSKFSAKVNKFFFIVFSVLLLDMRTRFGTSHLSYLIAIAWPLCHLAILEGAYLLRTMIAPIGDSPAMFVGTGVIPYILCLYPGRMMAMAVFQNRHLLNIPLVKPIHLIFGRCLLETLTASIVLVVFMLSLHLADVDIVPTDLATAGTAVAAAIYFGVGVGFLNVVMCAIFGPYFMVFFVISMVFLYIFSGVYIPTSTLPEEIRVYAAYNPLLNIVEWLRSAYYASYDSEAVNKTLVLALASVSLVLGLIGERILRGKFFG